MRTAFRYVLGALVGAALSLAAVIATFSIIGLALHVAARIVGYPYPLLLIIALTAAIWGVVFGVHHVAKGGCDEPKWEDDDE